MITFVAIALIGLVALLIGARVFRARLAGWIRPRYDREPLQLASVQERQDFDRPL